MPTRRSFLKLTGATTLAWYVATQTGWTQRAMAAIPGGTLDLTKVPKYVTPLLIPPVMPRTATITMPGGKPGDYYEISVQQFKQQILPTPLPMTTVWGYGPITPDRRTGLRIYHAPSLTIESTWKRPVRVKWINELVDANKNFLPHLLPVDPTLHWANPPQGSDPAYGTGPRDSRPTFTETPGTYTGPVPIVTHLHGAAGVGDESDGYAEAWFLPAANNIPAGYATKGTWYNFFRGQGRLEVRRHLGARVRDLPVPQ
jgi:spore coat protein A